jgi:hypothetical protein
MNLVKVVPYSLNGFWEVRLLWVSLAMVTTTLTHRGVLLVVSGAGLVVKGLFF